MNAVRPRQLRQLDTGLLPAELRDQDQWVCWKYVERGGRQTKLPVNARTGGPASSTDPSTWASLVQAVTARESNSGSAGVGFVFSKEDPFTGVDLDDCVDPASGAVADWAQRILARLDSYSEISPSGCGIKIFVRASKPGARCRAGYEGGAVEIYDRDRFFTVTGMVVPGCPLAVAEQQGALEAVYQQVFGDRSNTQGDRPMVGSPDLPDEQILALARRSRSGSKFESLWAGRWDGAFPSQSEADSALVFMLAFYTRDAGQLDRLFRQSGLFRPKWDELRGQRTYGDTTIENALANVTEQYRGAAPMPTPGVPAPADQTPTSLAPGTRDHDTGRLILSTSRTLPTAQAFTHLFFSHEDGQTLRTYGDVLWIWRDNRYGEMEDGAIRSYLLPWLHEAAQVRRDSKKRETVIEPFPANPRTVQAAIESLKAHTHTCRRPFRRLRGWVRTNGRSRARLWRAGMSCCTCRQ